MLKITSKDEAIEVGNVKILLYGQPGCYKTSTAFTANDPLLLDFDQGSYRSEFRKDVVQITDWSDISRMTADDLEPYQTVVVDTVGRLLDVLAVQIISDNPKMGRPSGALTLQGYGELKSNYAAWLKRLTAFGKDVVLIAHDKEEKRNDDTIVRPDIQGGSYGEVFKQADSIGYMYRSAKSVVLDFSPSDSWIGKNVAGFEPLVVPNFHQEPDFLANLIDTIKAAMNRVSEEGQKIQQLVTDWRAKIEELSTATAVNKAVDEVQKIQPKSAAIQVKHLLAQKAVDLGLTYQGEKGKGKYVKEAA